MGEVVQFRPRAQRVLPMIVDRDPGDEDTSAHGRAVAAQALAQLPPRESATVVVLPCDVEPDPYYS